MIKIIWKLWIGKNVGQKAFGNEYIHRVGIFDIVELILFIFLDGQNMDHNQLDICKNHG